MQNIQIIGVTGRKFTGKDTAGNYFVSNYGFERLAYADPLKNAVREIFNFTNEQLYGNEKEVLDTHWNVTPRKVLQFVGTDLFRNHIGEIVPGVGQDIWIRVMKRKIMDKLKDNPNAKIVVTDIRFDNESDAIKELGGVTIKSEREGVSNEDTHESEANIDAIKTDYVFSNNGTREDLFSQLKQTFHGRV